MRERERGRRDERKREGKKERTPLSERGRERVLVLPVFLDKD